MRAYLRAVWTLAAKDLLLERRSLASLASVISFALLLAVLFHFGFDIGPSEGARFFPGALWVALLFAGTLGVARAARMDEVDGRMAGLALAPVDRSALFFGRLLFLLAFMAAAEAVAVPAFVAVFSPGPVARPGLLTLGLFLGTWGFAALGTLLGGAGQGEKGTGLLLPLVLFPLLAPVVLGGVAVTGAAVRGSVGEQTWMWLRLLGVFDVLFTVIPALVYEYLVEV